MRPDLIERLRILGERPQDVSDSQIADTAREAADAIKELQQNHPVDEHIGDGPLGENVRALITRCESAEAALKELQRERDDRKALIREVIEEFMAAQFPHYTPDVSHVVEFAPEAPQVFVASCPCDEEPPP